MRSTRRVHRSVPSDLSFVTFCWSCRSAGNAMPITRCADSCLMSSFTLSTTNDWYAGLGACCPVKTTSRSVSEGTSHSPGRPCASGQKYSPSGSKMTVPTLAGALPGDGSTGSVAYSLENSSLIRLDLPNPALANTKLRRDTSCETWNFGRMAGCRVTIQSSAPARGRRGLDGHPAPRHPAEVPGLAAGVTPELRVRQGRIRQVQPDQAAVLQAVRDRSRAAVPRQGAGEGRHRHLRPGRRVLLAGRARPPGTVRRALADRTARCLHRTASA